MIQCITQDVYTQVCQGLFEKDKKLFSFIIAVQIMRIETSCPRRTPASDTAGP
jgi:hypothetical protein